MLLQCGCGWGFLDLLNCTGGPESPDRLGVVGATRRLLEGPPVPLWLRLAALLASLRSAAVSCGRPVSRPHGQRDLRSLPAYVVVRESGALSSSRKTSGLSDDLALRAGRPVSPASYNVAASPPRLSPLSVPPTATAATPSSRVAMLPVRPVGGAPIGRAARSPTDCVARRFAPALLIPRAIPARDGTRASARRVDWY